jgi:hypothetical protein
LPCDVTNRKDGQGGTSLPFNRGSAQYESAAVWPMP